MSPEPPEPPDSSEAPAPEIPRSLFGRFAKAARGNWRSRARPAQLPPEDFSIYFMLAGRGAGKNWSASNYVQEQGAIGGARRIALIGATANDTRFTMVEGESGIVAAAKAAGVALLYEPGKGQITWPSGCIARMFSADQPDSVRGTEHDLAWCDELASWRRADEMWGNLTFTMRIGARPRIIVTSTPKPTRLVRDLVARNGTDGIVVARMTTYDNRANLSPTFFAQLVKRFEGTRLARQELLAELLEDTPGALWNRDLLEATRVDEAPALQRIVIAIDPAGSNTEGSDETGVICAGLGQDGHGYILSDLSGRYAPNEWARKAIAAYHSLRADKIVVERNYGGQMVAATVLAIDAAVPVKEVTSSRGKVLRAEPVSSVFEQQRAHIVGTLPELEDQMCSFTSDWNRARDGSPDRIDAAVFALTELCLQDPPGRYLRTDSLLAPSDNGALEPVAVPAGVAEIFAAAAVVESEPDAIGVVFLAITRPPNAVAVLLDWDLRALEPTVFDSLYAAVATRLTELRAATRADSARSPIVIDPAGSGAVLVEEGAARGFDVRALETEEILLRPLVQRVIEFGSHLAGGRVKLAQPAHERMLEFKGVRRNHLVAQIGAFGIETEHSAVAPLLAAAASGALDALRADRWLDTWRRLGASKLLPTDARPIASEPAPVPESPPQPPPDSAVLMVMRTLGFDARNPSQDAAIRRKSEQQVAARAANEARIEAENVRAREAARTRAAREQIEEESR